MGARLRTDTLNRVTHSCFRLIVKRNCFRERRPSSLQSLTIWLTKHGDKIQGAVESLSQEPKGRIPQRQENSGSRGQCGDSLPSLLQGLFCAECAYWRKLCSQEKLCSFPRTIERGLSGCG